MPVAKPAPKQMFGFSTTRPTTVSTATPSRPSPVVAQVVPRSTTTAPSTSYPKTVGGYSASFQNAYNALNPTKPTPTPVARPAPVRASPAPTPVPAPAPQPETVADEDSPDYWYNILKGYGYKKGGSVKVTSRVKSTPKKSGKSSGW